MVKNNKRTSQLRRPGAPEINSPYAESVHRSLRRIIRAIDLHSRELATRFQLTVPQLVCLRQLQASGPVMPSELARQVYLSQATVTGIINRLEIRGLVQRERKQVDRRRVTVTLTDKGLEMIAAAPLPLQDRFAARLAALPLEEQDHISRILNQVVEMMEAGDIEAAPMMLGTLSLKAHPEAGDESAEAEVFKKDNHGQNP